MPTIERGLEQIVFLIWIILPFYLNGQILSTNSMFNWRPRLTVYLAPSHVFDNFKTLSRDYIVSYYHSQLDRNGGTKCKRFFQPDCARIIEKSMSTSQMCKPSLVFTCTSQWGLFLARGSNVLFLLVLISLAKCVPCYSIYNVRIMYYSHLSKKTYISWLLTTT